MRAVLITYGISKGLITTAKDKKFIVIATYCARQTVLGQLGLLVLDFGFLFFGFLWSFNRIYARWKFKPRAVNISVQKEESVKGLRQNPIRKNLIPE